MAINSSGQVSLGGATTGESINLELSKVATATISLDDTDVRTLAGSSFSTPGTQIQVPTDFYGKSLSTTPSWITSVDTAALASYLNVYFMEDLIENKYGFIGQYAPAGRASGAALILDPTTGVVTNFQAAGSDQAASGLNWLPEVNTGVCVMYWRITPTSAPGVQRCNLSGNQFQSTSTAVRSGYGYSSGHTSMYVTSANWLVTQVSGNRLGYFDITNTSTTGMSLAYPTTPATSFNRTTKLASGEVWASTSTLRQLMYVNPTPTNPGEVYTGYTYSAGPGVGINGLVNDGTNIYYQQAVTAVTSGYAIGLVKLTSSTKDIDWSYYYEWTGGQINGSFDPVFLDGYLYLCSQINGIILKINPSTGDVVKAIKIDISGTILNQNTINNFRKTSDNGLIIGIRDNRALATPNPNYYITNFLKLKKDLTQTGTYTNLGNTIILSNVTSDITKTAYPIAVTKTDTPFTISGTGYTTNSSLGTRVYPASSSYSTNTLTL